jgi:hypothetical protein
MGSLFAAVSLVIAMAVNIVPHPTKAQVADVERFETLIGAKLPAEYRDFLLASNGGKPDFSVDRNIYFPITWKGQAWSKALDGAFLETLGSLDPAAKSSLAKSFDYLRKSEKMIPDDTIAIGTAGGGAILLGVGAKNSGQVYYWSQAHMSHEDNRVPGYDNVGFVAKDFPAFLQLLRPYKEVRAEQAAKS